MTRAQGENIAWYVGFAFAGALVATGLKLAVVLPGDAPIPWRDLAGLFLLTFFGALTTTGGAMTRPKAGHEVQSALVDSVGHTTATTVLVDTAAAQIAGTQMTPFTPAQVRQIAEAMHEPVANDLEARMRETPAEGL